MFDLYRKSQAAQLNWICNHPVQYVALNAILIVVGIGSVNYWTRKKDRELENNTPQQDS